VILEICPDSFSTFMSITPCGLGPAKGLETPGLLKFNKNQHRSQGPGLMPVIPAFGKLRLNLGSRQAQANSSQDPISKITRGK
jgi:hypothetical protein